MTALLLLRRIWPYLAAGALVVASLLFVDHRGFQRGVASQQPAIVALTATIADVRAKTAQARADDLSNARRVETDQQKVTTNVSTDYQRELAGLRARYDRLRTTTTADSGSGGTAGVSGLPGAASGPDAAPAQDRLPVADALIASEQALQLGALIEWVRGQSEVPR